MKKREQNGSSPLTPREDWELSEQQRILQFIRDNNDLAYPPDGLNIQIRSDNGRLRLWLEIRSDTTLPLLKKHYSTLVSWKTRLGQDPLPHPIPTIIEQIFPTEAGRVALSINTVATQINSWIACRLMDWQKAKNNTTRRFISAEVNGLLQHFGFDTQGADEIMHEAQSKIRAGQYPFTKLITPTGSILPRNGHPVTRELLKSRLRTWRKKQNSP